MNKNAVTIADVAEQAGVSKTTVSHALSGKRPVALETRARIFQAIDELGFRPNQLARSLRMQQTQLVALIIPDITNPFYPVLARGLQDALKEQGYSLILCNTDSVLQQEIAFVTEAAHRKVDGVALASQYNRAENLRTFIESGLPFISVGTGIDHPNIDKVTTNDQQTISQAIHYLLERGHRRIALLGGPPDYAPAQMRRAGYQDALEHAGIPLREDFIVQGEFTLEGGGQGMRTLLARFPEPTKRPSAVFCANDLIAMGAMHTAREAGLVIPQDIAFIGFDDIAAASLITPPLTTIVNPAYDLGKISGQLLLERMQGRYDGPGRLVVIENRFILRATV